ncbi:MAG TPA: hypothetical protein VNZ64_20890 [Candidatus Acidoferrum sp.]|jgi:hypothetical protein|nr:hypothetical protein [Candidatus Acidoferrum sp.]
MNLVSPSNWCILLLWTCCCGGGAETVHHYVFLNRDRGRISDSVFIETKALEGAQLKYSCRELEPEKGAYDFSAVQHDLRILKEKGKRLFIQLQDSSFDPAMVNVPRYLTKEERYHGGADRQYRIEGNDEQHAVPEGWVARRWDPAVQDRFYKLLFALGKEFDGRIEGINLPETAAEFGASGRLFPKGFAPESYRDAIPTNMMVLKRAFQNSVAMHCANFMPGEWLPANDRSYLHTVYRRARELNVGGRPGSPTL